MTNKNKLDIENILENLESTKLPIDDNQQHNHTQKHYI